MSDEYEFQPVNLDLTRLYSWDIEVYPNFFVAGFMSHEGRVVQIEDPRALREFITLLRVAKFDPVGFNSGKYDDQIASEFMKGSDDPYNISPEYHAHLQSTKLITDPACKWWDFENTVHSIDIMALLPGQMSLKQLGVRLYHDHLQELPIDPMEMLDEAEKEVIREYNIVDLEVTWKGIRELKAEMQLRYDMSNQYHLDLRSKGNAQIAEAVIGKEVSILARSSIKALKIQARKNKAQGVVQVAFPSWWDQIPRTGMWVPYLMENQKHRFNSPIPLDANGRLLKGALDSTVYMDDIFYKTGVGGLHSIDGPGCHRADENHYLMDIDVASYYPRIALTQGFFPAHIREHYGEVYEAIVDRRLVAKRAGDKVTADSLKICVNGAYGKSSDPYSVLYDPQVTAGITITGQVALLILIAMLADNGIRTVSSNTDGITAYAEKKFHPVMKAVVTEWEQITGFEMEYTEYSATYSLDVNNYMATKPDGGIKSKGRFVTPPPGRHDLQHSLQFAICADAIKACLEDGIPLVHTITACRDINQFLITHAATGKFKCLYGDQELGKLVRFYKSTQQNLPQITKVDTELDLDRQAEFAKQVPSSENCIPVQNLPPFLPDDIDYDWYIDKAQEWLDQVTRPKTFGNNALAHSLHEDAGLFPIPVGDKNSNAFMQPGGYDFNSMPAGMSIGISTGKKAGLIAVVDEETQYVIMMYKFQGNLPTRTREKISKDEGWRIVYGANVKLPPDWRPGQTEIADLQPDVLQDWKSRFYTPSELKKAKADLQQ